MKLAVHELRRGTGVPLVLLHGWQGCAADFDALIAPDVWNGRTVLAVDLPGHGATEDYDREYDFSDVAVWLDEAIDAPLFDLLGYSMGGRVALYYTGTHAARVRSLMLIGAHPGIDHPVAQRQRLEVDVERASQLAETPLEFLREWAELDLFGPAESEAWRSVRARRVETAERLGYGWARALLCLSLGRQLSLWTVPYGLTKPTLFIAGMFDGKYVATGSELVAQNGGACGLAVIAEAHHAAHLDAPAEVAAKLNAFLPPA